MQSSFLRTIDCFLSLKRHSIVSLFLLVIRFVVVVVVVVVVGGVFRLS